MSFGDQHPAADLSPLIEIVAEHLSPVALAAARLLPIVWLVPLFGGRLLPVPARLTITVGLAWVLAPPIPPVAVDLTFAGHLLLEALTGLCLALLASLPFELARSGGHLVDVVRGSSLAQVIAPGLGDRATPTGDVLYLALLAALATCGGDRFIIVALTAGFAALPPGAAMEPGMTALMGDVLLETTAVMLSSALLLAAPVIIIALLSDTVLGVVGRIVPQLPLFFLGMPVKTVLGLVMVALALGPMLGTLLEKGLHMPEMLAIICELLRSSGT